MFGCRGLGALLAGVLLAAPAGAVTQVQVRIENLAPQNGIFLTPVWVGFHDGTFDTYDGGAPASTPLGGDEIERIAEDGNAGPLSETFTARGFSQQATVASDVGIPPIGPGETATTTFALDENDASNRYFSYASMLIPSNDAFVANGNPLAHAIFGPDGSFLGAEFFILGAQTNDAGTEVNDELPANTAFFGQTMPNTGTPEDGVVVTPHPGLLPAGSGGILDDPMFANADFLGYENDWIARVTVSPVPEPSAGLLMAVGLARLGLHRRRARAASRRRPTSKRP
ncbi:MAG: spondin domain-containing protein [Myxococcota bacterium]|nr:spondin domain-containing protein [Myxococcota bacterium]